MANPDEVAAGRPVVLRGGTVLTMDDAHTVLTDADVLVTGERIAAVGPRLQAPDGALEIDASGGIVMPGMIDTHRHMWQTAMRAYGADWTLTQYFEGPVRRLFLGHQEASGQAEHRLEDPQQHQPVGFIDHDDGEVFRAVLRSPPGHQRVMPMAEPETRCRRARRIAEYSVEPFQVAEMKAILQILLPLRRQDPGQGAQRHHDMDAGAA